LSLCFYHRWCWILSTPRQTTTSTRMKAQTSFMP
jgi:hypothetical protein